MSTTNEQVNLLIATPRYVSEARFIVRASNQSQPSAIGVALQGVGLSTAPSDAFAVHEYITSRDAVTDLGRRYDVGAILNPPGIFMLVIFSFGVMACAFMAPFFCAIWWRKANATGALASMVLGGGTNLVMTAMGYGDSAFFAGAIVSIIAMIVGSQFGKKTTPEMIALIDKAAAKNAKVAPKLQTASSKHLASEGKAVAQFIKNRELTSIC